MTNEAQLSTQERFKRGSADAGGFFRYIADFVDFTAQDADYIHQTRFVIEKYIPIIIGDFYSHLLSFPATRKPFLSSDGSVNRDYLQMRMQHQVSFWRRTAAGHFDDDYARFVDYVGRAHTSHGADPNIYIAERYVIGMISFVGQRVRDALATELHALDPDLERRGLDAWNKLLMILLEMLVRPYTQGPDSAASEPRHDVNANTLRELAYETYEMGLGIARRIDYEEVRVGRIADIPIGQRVVIQNGNLSIGVFHHTDDRWYALHNSCLHRGGPVCTGELAEGVLTCPWHGYQYELTSGKLLLDTDSSLPMFPVLIHADEVFVRIPHYVRDRAPVSLADLFADAATVSAKVEEVAVAAASATSSNNQATPLATNEFLKSQLAVGQMKKLMLGEAAVTVYNVDGNFYATADACTHVGGPLHEGKLNGNKVICPWHASCFDVTNGQVLQGPARKPLRCYQISFSGEVGRVEAQ